MECLRVEIECPSRGKLRSYVRMAKKQKAPILIFLDTVIRLNLNKQERPMIRTKFKMPPMTRTLYAIAFKKRDDDTSDFTYFTTLNSPPSKHPIWRAENYITSYYDEIKSALETKNLEVVLLNQKRSSLTPMP